MNIKCDVCGQTALNEAGETRFLVECREKLPAAIKTKTKDKELTNILTGYKLGKVTAYTILRGHDLLRKKPEKKIFLKNNRGKSDTEKLDIYNFYINFKGMDAAGETAKKFNISKTSVRRITSELVLEKGLSKKDNSLSYRVYELNENFFEKIDIEEKSYILGFLVGDGCIHDNIIELELAIEDEEHLIKIAKLIGSTKPLMKTIKIDKRKGEKYPAIKLTIISTKMVEDLKKLNIGERKSSTCNPNIELIPKKFHKDFFRGEFDADGSICLSKNFPTVIQFCGSPKCVEQFMDFIKEMTGIENPKVRDTGKIHQISYIVNTTTNDVAITKALYKDAIISLDRKNLRYKFINNLDGITFEDCEVNEEDKKILRQQQVKEIELSKINQMEK